MTQIPLSIEQTVASQPKRSTATKLVVGLLAVFAVVYLYENGQQPWEGLAGSRFSSSHILTWPTGRR